MEKENMISDELLENITGGKLPVGWQKMADALYPQYKAQYPDVTYEEACVLIQPYITDPEDYALVIEYIKKFLFYEKFFI